MLELHCIDVLDQNLVLVFVKQTQLQDIVTVVQEPMKKKKFGKMKKRQMSGKKEILEQYSLE